MCTTLHDPLKCRDGELGSTSFVNTGLSAYVLTSLPDFGRLASATLASKLVRSIFQEHSYSIAHSVTYNLVWPALHFVWCFNAKAVLNPLLNFWPRLILRKTNCSPMEISRALSPFPVLFSWRMKDRGSNTNQSSYRSRHIPESVVRVVPCTPHSTASITRRSLVLSL
ncbi:hypothetical protein BDR06DRAFT_154171 [Suillus hirtellus]|nr:hypothetical protein BDR06DRAFT_154171 [Suillus hirtellus]